MIDLGFLSTARLSRAEQRAIGFVVAASVRPGAALRATRLLQLANGNVAVELVARASSWRGMLLIDRQGQPQQMQQLDTGAALPSIAGVIYVFRDFEVGPVRLLGGTA